MTKPYNFENNSIVPEITTDTRREHQYHPYVHPYLPSPFYSSSGASPPAVSTANANPSNQLLIDYLLRMERTRIIRLPRWFIN